MTTKNFNISNETAGLINAIRFFQDFKEVYFSALVNIYGEEEANLILGEDQDTLDAVEAKLGKHLVYSITDHMADNNTSDELI